jgi:putative ABC transport system permease protein
VLPQKEFDVLFETALNDTAIEAYKSYGGMSSNAENDKKVAKALDEYLSKATDEDLIFFYDNHIPNKISDKSQLDVLSSVGYATLDNPSYIYIYPKDFEMKDNIADMIAEYNANVSEDDQIEYTDIAAMLMSSVSDIITAISVVLICFVSISLVVSSIMIGIITYISVLERTKEIGILRAIGASKRDISSVFNAETMIVGFLAGLVGITTTILLCFPISWIARSVTGIGSLTAVLPWYGYLLILLSVVLTLIAGLLPSSMAAKKDPVIALRTE